MIMILIRILKRHAFINTIKMEDVCDMDIYFHCLNIKRFIMHKRLCQK